ncbi:PREDICTED: uncharacterized protein LOC109217535 [Nicotiana attenuata]|uniref:uncharacterized protein LOC109217535 n=1 Tax=Nicotiana attenuata TaxID=49451 RepID=UPI000904784F|nr:PREDICTED: uncharacterized protein LOC109217535 [Nicotiana attenuata]
MFARKKVDGRELSKKLDAQLKASQAQEPHNSEESYKSATEGEETESSDTENVTSGPDTTTECQENKGSRSGEAAKGLVNLGQKVDEPGSSVEETLADLLKKVGDSYNPKKKRTSKAKTPGIARSNKKMKAAPSVTIEIPPTRGRATRSQLKQNEEELQRALEESKKKRMDKGKKKVGEPVEAVDVDEMDLVHQDEDVIAEVEVQTPKPKKAKTSTKKSTSMSKSVEPSTLTKRTRSAVKTKKENIAEEEWSG